MTTFKKYSLQEAIIADQYLLQLAAYESSKGMVRINNSIDDNLDLQKQIAKQFNYFKRLIQNGEASLDDIEQMVISMNGPVFNPYRNLTVAETLKEISANPPNVKPLDTVHNVNDAIDVLTLLLDRIDAIPDQTGSNKMPEPKSPFDISLSDWEKMTKKDVKIEPDNKNEQDIKKRAPRKRTSKKTKGESNN